MRKLTWEASFDRYRQRAAGTLETRDRSGTFRIEFQSSDRLDGRLSPTTTSSSTRRSDVAAASRCPSAATSSATCTAATALGPQRARERDPHVPRGGFYCGDRTQIGYTGRVKLTSQLAVEPRLSVDWVDLPRAASRRTLLGARTTYTITPRMFVSALVQYNSEPQHARNQRAVPVGVSARQRSLRRLHRRPRHDRPRLPELVNRGLAMKLTRLLRF